MRADTLLLINSKARFGDTAMQEGLALWQAQGWQIRQLRPPNPQEIPELIRTHGTEVERIIIGGGDGTLNRAAEALVESKRPLGVLPLGTANDFARTMQIPTDLLEACRVISTGLQHRIDLGWVNGKHFFNVAHIGLGKEVTQHLSRQEKRRWGGLAYLRGFIEAYKANRYFRVHLTCDGREEDFTSIQVAVGNGRHYGGGMTIAADAEIDDHLLNFFSLKPQSLVKLASLAVALRHGGIYNKERVVYRAGRELDIETNRLMGIDTDGELTTRTPARFRVIPDALTVYVPPHYEERKKNDAAFR